MPNLVKKIIKNGRFSKRTSTILSILLTLTFVVVAPRVFADFSQRNGDQTRQLGGKIRGFSVPQYFDVKVGQQAKIRTLLTGREAYPITGENKIYINGLRIECYDSEGNTNTVVTARECIYDIYKKTVESSDILRLAKADDTMSLQGIGFSWDHANSLLTISNQVRSSFIGMDISGFIKNNSATETNAAVNTNAMSRVLVTSRQFVFDQKNNNASYLGNVVITEKDGNAETSQESRLLCEKLHLTTSRDSNLEKEQSSFEQISGEGNVSITVQKTAKSEKSDQKLPALQHFAASGDQFIYARKQNELGISGNVQWSTDQQTGQADYVTLRNNGNDISATGNVQTVLQKSGFKKDGKPTNLGELIGIPMSKNSNTATVKKEDVLTTFSDNLNSVNNQITLFGNVAIRDGEAILKCKTLTITLMEKEEEKSESGTQIKQIEATGDIRVTHKDDRLETQHAIYRPNPEKDTEPNAIFQEQVRWFSDKLQAETDKLFAYAESPTRKTPRYAEAIGNTLVLLPIHGNIQPLELFGPEAAVTTEASANKPAQKETERSLQVTAAKMLIKDAPLDPTVTNRYSSITFLDQVHTEILPANPDKTEMHADQLILNFIPENNEDPHLLDNIYTDGHLEIMQTSKRPDKKNPGKMEVTTQKMSAKRMMAQLEPKSGDALYILAEEDVHLEQKDVQATGKRAYFDTATQQLELTGNPKAEMQQGTLYAEKMIWDRNAGVFRGVSRFRIEGKTK